MYKQFKTANQTLVDSNASLNSRVAELEDLVDKERSDAAEERADALKKRDMAWETNVVDFEGNHHRTLPSPALKPSLAARTQ